MTADSGEGPTGPADATALRDLTATPEVAAAEVPPEILAQSLGQYLRGWLLRVRSGNSGVLPVVLAIVAVAVAFEIVTPEHAFLRPSNLVYIFGLSTIYMVLAMAEIVVLLLGEIDLSVGAVALFGGVIAFKLVQVPGAGWPWWAAILTAVVGCGAVGALQGTMISRLKIPSFVVSLGGFLLFSGILVIVLGGADGTVSVSSSVPNQKVMYYMVQGMIDPVASWVVLAVVVGAVGTTLWLRGAARRREGLVAPPAGLTAIRIALVAIVGVATVMICTVNRGTSLVTVEGVPWVIPIVLVLLGAWTLLLQRTRFGRYVYAVGGNPEAARRAGVSLPAVRTWGFVLAALTSGMAGVLFASWQVSLTTNIIKTANSYVLLAVAAAVIGGTSLFGGRGKTIHGVLGGLVIGGIYNGLYLLGVASQWIDVVVAAVLLAAATIDVLSRRGAPRQA